MAVAPAFASRFILPSADPVDARSLAACKAIERKQNGKELPCIKLKKLNNRLYCISFNFLPDNSVVCYKGDIDTIQEHLQDGPIHHAIVIYYRRHSIVLRRWVLFGKNTNCRIVKQDPSQFTPFYTLHKRSIRKTKNGVTSGFSPASLSNKRFSYALIFVDSSSHMKVIQTYRKLPSEYLKALKKINKPHLRKFAFIAKGS